MPELDGYQTCRKLKSNPNTAKIPVIFVTAKTDVKDEKYGFEVGAVDYITKPISGAIVFLVTVCFISFYYGLIYFARTLTITMFITIKLHYY